MSSSESGSISCHIACGALASGAADAVCLKLGRCGGISGLLAAATLVRAAGAEPYIASTLDAGAPTLDAPASAESAGAVIGPHKLLQQLGERGMGTVFMAEQSHPVQREVAVKVITPGPKPRSC